MFLAMAAVLALPAGASARPADRVLVRTPGEITRLSLDRFGQAAWVQVNAAGTCLRIHRGRLLGHQNRAITRCSTPQGPTPAEDSAVAIAATARSAGSPLHIAWAERFESNSETLATVWVPDGRGGRARVERIFVECGSSSCGAPGRILGPMAARDGIVLYAVSGRGRSAGCDPETTTCMPVVTGGRIRWVRYSPAGVHATTVPGAPAAAALATAGGRLAEQPYTAGGDPAGVIQIRDVAGGGLEATIQVHGTLNAMAMSQKVLAALTTTASGNHLVRYDGRDGARLGSTPVAASLDTATIGLDDHLRAARSCTRHCEGMRIYRIDLGRTLAVGIGPRTSPVLDRDGIRWVTHGAWTVGWAAQPSAIHGLDHGLGARELRADHLASRRDAAALRRDRHRGRSQRTRLRGVPGPGRAARRRAGAARRAGRRGGHRGDRAGIPVQRGVVRGVAPSPRDRARPGASPARARHPAARRHPDAARRRLPVARERPRPHRARAAPVVAHRRRGIRGVQPAHGPDGALHQADPVGRARRPGPDPAGRVALAGAARAPLREPAAAPARHVHPAHDDERGRLPRPVVRDRPAQGHDGCLGHHRHVPGHPLARHRLRAAAPLHGRDRRRLPRLGHPARRHRRSQPLDRLGGPRAGGRDPDGGAGGGDRRAGRPGHRRHTRGRARRSWPTPSSQAPTRA